MFDFIKNLFPIKARSIEKFVDIVKRERCRDIVVRPDRVNIGTGQFEYFVIFKAKTNTGRNIYYNNICFKHKNNYHWFFDAEKEWKAAIQVYLIAEKKLEDLKIKLPGVTAILVRPEPGHRNRHMDKAMYDKLHSDAAACGIS